MESSRVIEHPILGYLVLKGSEQTGLTDVAFHSTAPKVATSDDALLKRVEKRLQEYLLGQPVDFGDIPLNPIGTPFQKMVWKVLSSIPWGETRSYKWVAEQASRPRGSRAIGQANGKNPIPIIIPCHRVIQQDGSLGGYSGGLHIKHFLLSLEQHHVIQSTLQLQSVLIPTKSEAITLL